MKFFKNLFKKIGAFLKKWWRKLFGKKMADAIEKDIVEQRVDPNKILETLPEKARRKAKEELRDYVNQGIATKPQEPAFKEGQIYFEQVARSIQKIQAQQRLSYLEGKKLKWYENYFVSYGVNIIKTPRSRWVRWVSYNTVTKIAHIKMVRGKIVYPFFNVPKYKFLLFLLKVSAGKYMWDEFGQKFSLNPERWIRSAKV